MGEQLEFCRQGSIATISLNRVPQRNALTEMMLDDLARIAGDLAADDAIRAVIIRANGDDFSVGMDLAHMQPTEPASSMLALWHRAEKGARLVRSLLEIPQPTICAIQGIATGGATCIASACDFRLADNTARMGYGEVRLGMNLMWHGLGLCVHLVGPARAKQMLMSGKLFPVYTLEKWGFVDDICSQGELDERAVAWAEQYAALPPLAVQMIKRSVNQLSGALDQAILHMDTDQWMLCTQSEDFSEAVNAFLAKRPGNFSGN
jgi:enoyl-CoA hydratase